MFTGCLFSVYSNCISPYQAFFTNYDFNFIATMPSMRQSMSWPSAASGNKRMDLTLVPTFTTDDEPLIFKSLTMVTLSPSCNTVPCASLMVAASSDAAASSALHSCAQSGQSNITPSVYVYSDWHCGQLGKDMVHLFKAKPAL